MIGICKNWSDAGNCCQCYILGQNGRKMDVTSEQIKALCAMIDRFVRLCASEDWQDEFNPTQASALAYLAHTNKLSRAPSLVAKYFCATRGATA
jgi:hypothetical protein